MESSHANNTGLAKFISKYLYEGISYNPYRQTHPNSRDTINGFPIRLVLKNTGTEQLPDANTSEPQPGATKDLGIFNFNLDKSSYKSFGLDVEAYPQCKSYEVVANSDTSAGAFVSYRTGGNLLIYGKSIDSTNLYNSDTIGGWCSNYIKVTPGSRITFNPTNIATTNIELLTYKSMNNLRQTLVVTKGATVTLENDINYIRINCWDKAQGVPSSIIINGETYTTSVTTIESQIHSLYTKATEGNPEKELAYLQESFELRYPDADDVGSDYGYLSTNGNTEYSLKRVIDKVDAWDVTTSEGIAQMRREFEDYFDLGYTLRYLLCVLTFGMVDNLG